MAVERASETTEGYESQASKRKPTISIVGAGRLGTALGCGFASVGFPIEAVVARSMRSAQRAATLITPRPLTLVSSNLDQLPASDIILITTPDYKIAATAAKISQTSKSRRSRAKNRRGQTALHASGALSSIVLESLREEGYATGSMHPLISVSDPIHGAQSLSSAFFCIEGAPSAIRVARRLVRALGAQSFSISAADKALYHAAAVITSGHTTALFDIAMEMLTRCGLTARRARAVLLPLLRSTLENLVSNDPARALTGTFARADTATVRKHLTALHSLKVDDALAVYTLLGKRSLRLAKAAGATPASLNEIALLLTDSTTKKGA